MSPSIELRGGGVGYGVLVPYYDISTARIDMSAIDDTTQNTTHKKKLDTTWCRRHVRVSGRRVGKTWIDVFKINFWRHQKCRHFRLRLLLEIVKIFPSNFLHTPCLPKNCGRPVASCCFLPPPWPFACNPPLPLPPCPLLIVIEY
jgi:hypothetical protein